jgi:hypothetical protein
VGVQEPGPAGGGGAHDGAGQSEAKVVQVNDVMPCDLAPDSVRPKGDRDLRVASTGYPDHLQAVDRFPVGQAPRGTDNIAIQGEDGYFVTRGHLS